MPVTAVPEGYELSPGWEPYEGNSSCSTSYGAGDFCIGPGKWRHKRTKQVTCEDHAVEDEALIDLDPIGNLTRKIIRWAREGRVPYRQTEEITRVVLHLAAENEALSKIASLARDVLDHCGPEYLGEELVRALVALGDKTTTGTRFGEDKMSEATFDNDRYQLVVGLERGGAYFHIWHQPANHHLDVAAVVAGSRVTINDAAEEPAPRLPPECLKLLGELRGRYDAAKASGTQPSRPSAEEVDAVAKSLGFNITGHVYSVLSG